MSGIINSTVLSAALALTNDAVLGASGLSSPIAAGQKQKIRWWLPITVGATGGAQFQVVVPAAVTSFIAQIVFYNTVAGAVAQAAAQLASAAAGNALANAGTHFVCIEAIITNGVNAGTVDLQIAQNTADALTLTLLAGASQEVTIVS